MSWTRLTLPFSTAPTSLDLGPILQKIRGVPIIHTESYVCRLPPGHRFQMKKFRGVYQSLVQDRIIDPKTQVGLME